MSEFNPWKYVQIDPDRLKNNPYLHPKKKEEVQEPIQSKKSVKVSSKDDYLLLEDIVCVDANGNEFEKYDKIYVKKDIERDDKGKQINYTPYQAITYFEQQNHFLPSFALSCNILAALYSDKSNPESNKVLMQYKDKGHGFGGHAQNTIIKWNLGQGEVIHYPHDSDFSNNGGSDDVNQGKRKSLDFKVKSFGDMELKEALKKKHFKNYLKNLTGLQNPEILIDIGDYFSKPAKVWASNNVRKVETTRSPWLGCNFNNLILSTISNFDVNSAIRGVLFGEPR